MILMQMNEARQPARAGTDGDETRLNDSVGQAFGRVSQRTLSFAQALTSY